MSGMKSSSSRSESAARARIDEISAEIIFLLSLDPDHLTQEHPNALPELGTHRVPMLLMKIFNIRSAIALATPTLWATLVIRTEEDGRAPFFGDQILDLLCAAPNLVESTLQVHMRPIDNVTLCDCDGHILDCLPLPALETLSVQMDEDSGSLPDLGLPSPRIVACLGLFQCFILIPTLPRLGLLLPEPGLVAAVFAVRVLTNSHSLLPNLRSLIIDLSNISDSEFAWREALRVASLRRSIHVDIFSTCNLPEDVLAGFRESVADGVRILRYSSA
ncbi:hypothetical protein B0H14DRAFT_3853742 [Mycena olivaceomarginata]|nr:hypothetical protein B0H14DRAFT_3853742 [Mycena olivaceomarginata]